MNMIFVLLLALAADTPQKPATRSLMLADAEARPRLAAATARPMRLVEPPPAGGVELMQMDREKIEVEARPADKPAPFPAEPKPPR